MSRAILKPLGPKPRGKSVQQSAFPHERAEAQYVCQKGARVVDFKSALLAYEVEGGGDLTLHCQIVNISFQVTKFENCLSGNSRLTTQEIVIIYKTPMKRPMLLL